MAAKQIIELGPDSFVGNVGELDCCHAREQLPTQMRAASGAGRAECDLAGLSLRERDQLLDRSRWQGRMCDQCKCRRADEANRRKISPRIVAEIGINRGRDRQGPWISQSQRVAVRCTFCDLAHRYRATATAAVLHDDLLTQALAHLLGNGPPHYVGAATSCERHNQCDWS